MSGRSLTKWSLGVLGVAVSAVLIASAFYDIRLRGEGPLLTPRFDLLRFLAGLPTHLHWLLPFAALTASIIPLRAIQWQATLAAPVPFRERYHLVAIGAFVHNALPGKFGDLFRSFLMARTKRVPFVQTLGSVAVCKLLEFAALMLLVSASMIGPFGETIGRFEGALRVATGVCLGLVVLVVALARFSGPLAARLGRHGRWPRLIAFLANVAVGLGTARSLRGMAWALCLSVPPVLAPALGYGLALQAIGVRGGIFAGAVVLGAIALGQATPGIPAGTGIYYFVTSWTARNLGASDDDAAAFAALTHLGTVVTQILVGLVSVLVRRVRWRELRRGAGAAAEAVKHAKDERAEPARA